MNNFWDQRYSIKDYAYGEEANQFLRDELPKLTPGTILFPGEGEGRNAVFAAKLGWNVLAFDASKEGKEKAIKLSNKHNVDIDYTVRSYENVEYKQNSFDCIVLVFAHMPSDMRELNHKKLSTFLKPGGRIILEGFSKEQLNYSSGGPRNYEMLFSEKELENDFAHFSELRIRKTETVLNEGLFHKGRASVIRLIGIK